MSWTKDLTSRQADKLAKHVGVRMPRMGYEMSLGGGAWLAAGGHFQFGTVGMSDEAIKRLRARPYTVRCRCERTCVEPCPVAVARRMWGDK